MSIKNKDAEMGIKSQKCIVNLGDMIKFFEAVSAMIGDDSCTLNISNKSLSIETMDFPRIGFVKAELETIIPEDENKNEGTFSLDINTEEISILLNVLKNSKFLDFKTKNAEIKGFFFDAYGRSDFTKLKIQIEDLLDFEFSHGIPNLKQRKLPDCEIGFNDSSEFSCPGSILSTYIEIYKKIYTEGIHFVILKNGECRMNCKNQEIYDFSFLISTTSKGPESRSVYSIEYLSAISKILENIEGPVTINFKTDFPMRIAFKPCEKANIIYLIAPIIE